MNGLPSIGGLPPGTTVGIHVRQGQPAKEIARFARDVGADLVLLGSDKRHVGGWYSTATVASLLELASCPVVVAGPEPPARAKHAIEIEPACPDCLSTRATSKGERWWCARHSEHSKRAHAFSYQRELPLRTHDSAVIPTGIDMD